MKHDAEMYVGCVSGAIQKDAYLKLVQDAGFTNIQIQKERKIGLPDDVMQKFLSAAQIVDYRQQDRGTPARGIISVTVFAQKPADSSTAATACKPGSGYC